MAMWMIGEFIVIAGSCIVAYVSIVQRLTRLETKWEATIDTIGIKIAKKLHSPDDHNGIDVYLDKYLDKQDLSLNEWTELRDKCNEIEHKMHVGKEEKILATLMAAVCEHKMKAYVKRFQLVGEGLVDEFNV